MSTATVSTAPAPRGASRRTYTHLLALDHALLLENLSAARQAFASLQEAAPDLAEIVHTAPLPSDSPRRSQFRQLAQALRSGKIKLARVAFSRFQENAGVDSHHPYANVSAIRTAS